MLGRCGRTVITSSIGSAFVIAALTAACSSRTTPVPQPAAADRGNTPSPAAQPLWGDLKPAVSVKELMRDMIDPASDFVFDSVGTIITKKGRVERLPKTQADWDRIRIGAVTLAEGVYLLKIPRPFAPPGDDNNSGGAEPYELSPAQITAKLEADPVLWNAKIEALRNVGFEVLEIVKRKDVDELWDAAENLDQACEACHLEYWYPGEKILMKKLDARLEELFGPRTGRTLKFGMER
jgi:cytochrome c556